MSGEFKGTKGVAGACGQVGDKKGCHMAQVFIGGISAVCIDPTENPDEATQNALLIADAFNVRQKINMSLSELLNAYNNLNKNG